MNIFTGLSKSEEAQKVPDIFREDRSSQFVCRNSKNDEYDYAVERMKIFLSKIGMAHSCIKPPHHCNLFCVKLKDGRWGAMLYGEKEPVVSFGKYYHMWGFDDWHCLISLDKTFASRGIIDSNGAMVVEPYTYDNIWNFYKKPYSTIRVEQGEYYYELNRINPRIIEKKTSNINSFYDACI